MQSSLRLFRPALKQMQKVNAVQMQLMAPRAAQARINPFLLGVQNRRAFRQVHDLHEVVYTTEQELAGRTAKYLERTDKVYKPSQTLEFNREGELLLWSCDNIKNSTIYLKYPYCTQMMCIPLSWICFRSSVIKLSTLSRR